MTWKRDAKNPSIVIKPPKDCRYIHIRLANEVTCYELAPAGYQDEAGHQKLLADVGRRMDKVLAHHLVSHSVCNLYDSEVF